MYKIINDFEKQNSIYKINYMDQLLACGNTVKMYELNSIHELIQFIGYAKYINKDGANVYFRGQPDVYKGAMIPSLYRDANHYERKLMAFNKNIKDIMNKSCFKNYDKNVLVPLLQHYGIKTPWIDLVDNVWVALWFSLHQAESKIINSREYVYYHDSRTEYAYIVLMATDATSTADPLGISIGIDTTIVDLRKVTPSFFLRPHAQHAYMIKKNDEKMADYTDLIVGIARIPTQLGLKWLGTNDFLQLNCLFPSPHFDTGYAFLLKNYTETKGVSGYGSIQVLSD